MACCSGSLPDAARVVLGPRDDKVTLVVEGAREDLVSVALQGLQSYEQGDRQQHCEGKATQINNPFRTSELTWLNNCQNKDWRELVSIRNNVVCPRKAM